MSEPNIIINDGGLIQQCFLINMTENDNTLLNYILSSSSMTELVIKNAGMTSHHLRAICDDKFAIKKLKKLQRLDVSNNHLTDEDISLLTELIRKKCHKLATFVVNGQRVLV
ncbi:hypothetical protein BGX28_003791 [Mortierella sp. GBA30]|nr:hypothetical protein BGX28_003791 [Mortierella sp. GBA30]